MDSTHARLLEAVKHYRMPQAAVDLLTTNPPMVLAGITGVGKDTIEDYIEKTSGWQHIVTHTTRQLRPGDTNGKDYWFVSEEEMLNLVAVQAFIEVDFVHEIQVSGTSLEAYNSVLRAGRKPIVDITLKGVQDLYIHIPGIRSFFILPPSFEVWMERLEKRGHMSHVERAKRIDSAKKELEAAIQNEHFILVINDELPRVTKEILDNITDIPSQQRNRELAQRLIDHINAY